MNDTAREAARQKAKALRFKRPMLETLNLSFIRDELDTISSEAYEIQWHEANGTLLDAFDGDEEEEFEFKMAFSAVEASAEQLQEAISEWFDHYTDDGYRDFDDCLVALIGNRYQEVGYDDYEEDYFSLCGYETELAQSEAGKRLCRKTKAQLISHIGQCLGIVLAFADLQLQYDRLSATLEILRGENAALLETIKSIEKLYEDGKTDASEWKAILIGLPDRMWVE